jgi:hypothetical protein
MAFTEYAYKKHEHTCNTKTIEALTTEMKITIYIKGDILRK